VFYGEPLFATIGSILLQWCFYGSKCEILHWNRFCYTGVARKLICVSQRYATDAQQPYVADEANLPLTTRVFVPSRVPQLPLCSGITSGGRTPYWTVPYGKGDMCRRSACPGRPYSCHASTYAKGLTIGVATTFVNERGLHRGPVRRGSDGLHRGPCLCRKPMWLR
jgi:hypothetical protein